MKLAVLSRLEVSLVAYVATEGGSLPVRSPLVKPLRPSRSAPFSSKAGPVHVADLLSREGHPAADRVVAARDKEKEPEGGTSAKRAIGMAAGAMLVVGTVVAGALGLNQSPTSTPTASGEPVGALPSPGPSAPDQAQAPAASGPVSQQFTNAAAAEGAPQASPVPGGQIGTPARVKPPVAAPKPAPKPAPAPAPAAPAPEAPSAGPVQSLTEPVTNTVGGGTLSGVLTPVTSTVDDTLQPALSLVGGLLGR